MQLDKDRFLTQYNSAINEYRKRVRRNDMGGFIDIPPDIAELYITSENLPCGCPKLWKVPRSPQCILNQPLMMVIPPDGVHLSCNAHPEGHHVFGSQMSY